MLTLNHETGMSEWQPVSAVSVFPRARREMVPMQGNELSSLTTLNHRWPVERRNARAGSYVRRWATSESLSAGDRIPTAAFVSDVPTEPKWTDALVETVAWFWTEGRFASGRQKGVKGRGISIAQSWQKNADNAERIRCALTSLFGPAVERMSKTGSRADQAACWTESVDDDMLIFRLTVSAADTVTAHAPGKVVMTAFLRSLTRSQLDLFLTVSLLADNNGVERLAQKSREAAEQFGLAAILAGYAVSVRETHPEPGGRFGSGPMWNVRIKRTRHFYPQEAQDRPGTAFRVRRVSYDGRVWCPRTPNETWLARRNGSIYFTGNSRIPDPMANFKGMSSLTPVIRTRR